MFQEFWINVQYGINHVLDINAYDHVLFLIVLAVPYLFKDWKRVLWLVTMFTVGHTISLILASYGKVKIDGNLIEFLIPVTILIVAVYNVFTAGKIAKSQKIGLLFVSTLFFGLVHGFGFAREFRMSLDQGDSKLLRLVEFALGIEIAQIIIVFVVLFLSYIFQTVFRFSKRDWVMVISAIVVGLVIPMLLNSPFLG
ncbi:HupE/UreJ family protein [Olleya sp. UBA1516]|uniref:HupE/UreJ family protein n=1 Tax=Olleya sp. UBA1516 TaxID=1947013 RepID=UPI0025EFA3BF|nr:HupE/UreJ family protein [Olleya sp. UBA1516]|tara:strand:- start:3002 stop:3592 length:591 start_codon:yes stop_codon:yes gene_type:complete